MINFLFRSYAKRKPSSILDKARVLSNQVHHADVIEEEAVESPMQTQEETADKGFTARKRCSTFTSLGSLLDSTSTKLEDSANRRLLLSECKNPLHVIDGTHSRYYMGIIDFFTQYKCKQQVAHVLKVCKNCTCDHSTVPPDIYAERFLRFIEERTL